MVVVESLDDGVGDHGQVAGAFRRGQRRASVEKYPPYPQPRSHTFRSWQGPRPSAMCSAVGSVRCAQRPMVTRREGWLSSSLRLKSSSAQLRSMGCRKRPSGSCSSPRSCRKFPRRFRRGRTTAKYRHSESASRRHGRLSVGGEIDVAEAIGLPRPGQRPATEVITAKPEELASFRREVRMFAVLTHHCLVAELNA